jgi:hypothetical protein
MNVTITTDTPIPAGTTTLVPGGPGPAPTPTPPPVPPPTPIAGPKPVGIQSFYRTNNEDAQAKSLGSTQAYDRYDWGDIERAPGQYDISQIVRDCNAAKSAGQRFNFRIMPYEDGNPGPTGLKALAGNQFNFGGNPTWQPNLNDLAVQADLDKLLAALGAALAANTATVDIGWWGPYGEWSNYNIDVMPPRPTQATVNWLIATTKKYFPNSYAIIQEGLATDDPPSFAAALKAGCGVRFDSWGAWNNSWQVNEWNPAVAAIQQAQQWTKAPIILEPMGTMSGWLGLNWQQSFDWAINTIHAWMFSNKSSQIPSVMLPYVQQLIAAEKQL